MNSSYLPMVSRAFSAAALRWILLSGISLSLIIFGDLDNSSKQLAVAALVVFGNLGVMLAQLMNFGDFESVSKDFSPQDAGSHLGKSLGSMNWSMPKGYTVLVGLIYIVVQLMAIYK
jgi:hypothetical protein